MEDAPASKRRKIAEAEEEAPEAEDGTWLFGYARSLGDAEARDAMGLDGDATLLRLDGRAWAKGLAGPLAALRAPAKADDGSDDARTRLTQALHPLCSSSGVLVVDVTGATAAALEAAPITAAAGSGSAAGLGSGAPSLAAGLGSGALTS